MNLDPASSGNCKGNGPSTRFSFQPLKKSLCTSKEVLFSLCSIAVVIGRAKSGRAVVRPTKPSCYAG